MGLWGDKDDPWPPTLLDRLSGFEVCVTGLAGILMLGILGMGWVIVLLYATGIM